MTNKTYKDFTDLTHEILGVFETKESPIKKEEYIEFMEQLAGEANFRVKCAKERKQNGLRLACEMTNAEMRLSSEGVMFGDVPDRKHKK